jgi:hypothetical protein
MYRGVPVCLGPRDCRPKGCGCGAGGRFVTERRDWFDRGRTFGCSRTIALQETDGQVTIRIGTQHTFNALSQL